MGYKKEKHMEKKLRYGWIVIFMGLTSSFFLINPAKLD